MRTEAALIGPHRDDSTVIFDEECDILHSALRLARSEDKYENAIARALCKCEKQGDTLESFLGAVLSEEEEREGAAVGLFWDGDEGITFVGQGSEGHQELTALKALKKIFESGGWLAQFLECHLDYYLKTSPTPLQVMTHLVEEAANFDCEIDHAKDLVKRYPKLFVDEPVKAAAKAAGGANA